eukprot:jgi/Phyca11/118956/e_gw1.37.259.1
MWRNRLLREALDDEEEAYVCSLLLTPRAPKKRKHGGSQPGKTANIDRDFTAANEMLVRRYFAETPLHDDRTFARRYRMSKSLFMRVHDELISHYPYFRQRFDATGKPGISSLLKITAAFRMLAYAKAGDEMDEVCSIGESTAFEILDEFCFAVVKHFGPTYLRVPTEHDISALLDVNKARGFP